jgi:hypothetical protein
MLNLSDHEIKEREAVSGVEPANLASSEAQYLATARPALEMHLRSGANWFFWIAALSLINSVILLTNGHWSFLAGLGITQFIDVLASQVSDSVGSAGTVIAMVLNVTVFGAFVLFGIQARKRQNWAFIVGMVLYGLDGLLFLLVQGWLSIAFHIFALYCIFKGMSANNRLTELEKAAGVTGN